MGKFTLAISLTLTVCGIFACPTEILAQEANQPIAIESSPTLIDPPNAQTSSPENWLSGGPKEWTSPGGLTNTLKVFLTLTVISLAPAVLLMTTCFVRVIVVLGLLRQALGVQQTPPSQVMTSLALFITLAVMSPTWTKVYQESIAPYSAGKIDLQTAWDAGVSPVRQFMSLQIEHNGNSDDVWLFYERLPDAKPDSIRTYDDVPLQALLPAFLLSELKTAFLIGFQLYLPFLLIDIVVSTIAVSMGMLMLPPVLISAPLKLLLFVLVDGWRLVVGSLLDSFQMAL